MCCFCIRSNRCNPCGRFDNQCRRCENRQRFDNNCQKWDNCCQRFENSLRWDDSEDFDRDNKSFGCQSYPQSF